MWCINRSKSNPRTLAALGCQDHAVHRTLGSKSLDSDWVQVLEERTGDLQRQLLLTQSELKAAREDAHIHELNKSQLQAQLAGKLDHLLQLNVGESCNVWFRQDSHEGSNAGWYAAALSLYPAMASFLWQVLASAVCKYPNSM